MFCGNRSREGLTVTDVSEEFASILYILIPIGGGGSSVPELPMKCY
jgi:hypothetical protein